MCKGLALSSGSAVVFLALEILLSFSSSCWGQAQQLALSPGCLLTAAGGSVRGPGVAEEGSSAPQGVPTPLPKEESMSCRGDMGVTSLSNSLRGLRSSGVPV